MRTAQPRIMTAYTCTRCDVSGRSEDRDPECWSCERPDSVRVLARPLSDSLPAEYGG